MYYLNVSNAVNIRKGKERREMKKITSVYRYRLDKEKEDGTFCGCEFFDTLEEAEFFGKIHQDFVEKTFNLISFNTKRLFTVWEVKVKPNHKKDRGKR